jgi:5-formyltetrahydrofolate cyclo-ligase
MIQSLPPGAQQNVSNHLTTDNGGAFYDRTLAALTKKPRAIGVGYSQAAIATIYPLRHDIPMDVIVTEEGIIERSAN